MKGTHPESARRRTAFRFIILIGILYDFSLPGVIAFCVLAHSGCGAVLRLGWRASHPVMNIDRASGMR
jgi:hypothetical protein